MADVASEVLLEADLASEARKQAPAAKQVLLVRQVQPAQAQAPHAPDEAQPAPAKTQALPARPPSAKPPAMEGFLEFFGRHTDSECWVFCGWSSRAYMAVATRQITAAFERGTETGEALVAFHEREDLGGRGIGFILLLQTQQSRLGALQKLQFNHQEPPVSIGLLSGLHEVSSDAIAERCLTILRKALPGDHTQAMQDLLARKLIGQGYLDFYGYHAPSIGWFICGWVSNDWIAAAGETGEVVAQFDGGTALGPAIINYYEREDIRNVGLGFILHLASSRSRLGQLLLLRLRAGNAVVVTRPARALAQIPADQISHHVQALIQRSDHGAARDALQDLAARAPHDGRETMGELAGKVFIELDEIIVCAPDGVLLFGWMLARPGVVKAIRLRSGVQVFPADLTRNFFWLDRPDVIEALGSQHGFYDTRCGFLARIATPEPLEGELYLEVETSTGETGIKTLPKSRLEGLPAMKRALGGIDVQYGDIDRIYDHILGPAIKALNDKRLLDEPRVQALQMGPPVAAPRSSLIVPLYGRIDFMDLQLALFATHGIGEDVEIIYVLDDPKLTREAQFKAASLYERFRVPFRLLCLSHNVGFAPANNIGLRHSFGRIICFMNSDVFPTTGDWLDRLGAHLEADPGLGVVGPVLLFEDDSVQHQGMAFKKLAQFANWPFPIHKRKGFRLPPHTRLVREDMLTGACLVVRREQALAYGGFDEAFVVGDFEDTDLCFKLAADGFHAAVDFGVRMYHLERKSQASSANMWRVNLTIYNAWLHTRRWAGAIGRLQAKA